MHFSLHGSDLSLICVDTSSSKVSFQEPTCFMIKSKYHWVSYLQVLKQKWRWKSGDLLCVQKETTAWYVGPIAFNSGCLFIAKEYHLLLILIDVFIDFFDRCEIKTL
jgi:hypothetical protein